MQITRATLEDARAVSEIHVGSWQAAYAHILPADFLAALSIDGREKWWRECIAAGSPELLVAKDKGAVVGWVNFGKCRDSGAPASQGEICAFYVAPSSWSRGIGQKLWLRAAEALAKQNFNSCSLWVLSQNVRAISFYEGCGFAKDSASAKQFELGGVQVQEVRYVRRLDG